MSDSMSGTVLLVSGHPFPCAELRGRGEAWQMLAVTEMTDLTRLPLRDSRPSQGVSLRDTTYSLYRESRSFQN